MEGCCSESSSQSESQNFKIDLRALLSQNPHSVYWNNHHAANWWVASRDLYASPCRSNRSLSLPNSYNKRYNYGSQAFAVCTPTRRVASRPFSLNRSSLSAIRCGSFFFFSWIRPTNQNKKTNKKTFVKQVSKRIRTHWMCFVCLTLMKTREKANQVSSIQVLISNESGVKS